MQAVYGDQCVDVSTVTRWVRFQKQNSNFLKDDLKTGEALAEVYWSAGDFAEK